ncbi:MAG: DUF4350 domain-containing protein [Rhodothermia bacterium]|nr:DUF4350 domain-containing protein [Rhodothermia bacterium]
MNLSRIDRFLWAALILGVVFYVFYEATKPAPPDWRPTFAPKDKIPYGLYALDKILPQAFPNQKLHRTEKSAYELLSALNIQNKSNTNFVWIDIGVGLSPLTIKALKQFVKKGNTAFISSYYWPKTLKDSLKADVGYGNEMPGSAAVNQFARSVSETSDTSSVGLRHTHFKDKKFWFPAFMQNVPFRAYDSTRTQVLGDAFYKTNKIFEAEPNFIRMKIGDGFLFLHTQPYAFTNYGLLKQNKAAYAFGVLSHLPVQETYFDAYRRGSTTDESLMQYVWRSDALQWAFYGLSLLLFFSFFSATKRRQRIIPVWELPRNTTREFVQTLGRLYYRRKDHKDLANRKITYFMESIRSRYYVQTDHLDDAFFEHLAAKTGHSKDSVASLFNFFEHLQKKAVLNDEDLRELTRRIYRF